MIATFLLLTTLTFQVPGIDCSGCAKPIAKTLSAIAGVSNIHVDWKKKRATIDVPPDFDRERLRKAMLNAGYRDGHFVVSGRQIPRTGGVILARGDDRDAIEALAAEDPFVRGGVARVQVIQFNASQTADGFEAFK